MSKIVRTSVVIPVYNEKEYLKPCLEALQRQTVTVDEVIVVDNNTNDGSIAAAKKQFKNVTFIDEKRQGIVFARNTGFNAAHGRILVKLDADTIVKPTWHENLLETIGNFDAWTGYVDNKELNAILQPIVNPTFRFFTFTLNRLIARTHFLFGCNMALTREAWKTIEPRLAMRNDIWEDLDMSLALREVGLSATTSTYRGAYISARSANAPIGRFYKRLYGHTRVYLLRRRWVSVALSLTYVHVSFLVWFVLKPLSSIGQTISRRPRPEQY